MFSVVFSSTVRIWSSSNESKVLKAHEPAVWTLSGLAKFDGSKRILSGLLLLSLLPVCGKHLNKVDCFCLVAFVTACLSIL